MNELFQLLFCLALYGLWRLAGWQLEKRRAVVPWRKVRILWPTFMLAYSWALFWMLRSGITDQWLVVLYGVFSFLNTPAMILMNLAGEISGNSLHPPDWLRYLLSSLLIWGVNYGMVLLGEARAWSRVPVSLNLTTRDHNRPD